MAVRERVARGESPNEAEAAARREMGNEALIKEAARAQWGWGSFERFRQDARYGLRLLRRSPGFAAVAILTLALGIGASTAILSVVDAILVRPLAYADPSRLVVILKGGDSPVAPANFLDWKAQSGSFENMGAAEYWSPNLTGGELAREGLGDPDDRGRSAAPRRAAGPRTLLPALGDGGRREPRRGPRATRCGRAASARIPRFSARRSCSTASPTPSWA